MQPQICCCVFYGLPIHHLIQMRENYCHNIKMEKVVIAGSKCWANKSSKNTWSRREEKLPDNEDEYSSSSSSSSKDRTSCSSKTFKQAHRADMPFSKICYSLLENIIDLCGCMQKPWMSTRAKSVNIYSPRHSLYHRETSACILTLSTSTCSSTRRSLLTPVQKKNT